MWLIIIIGIAIKVKSLNSVNISNEIPSKLPCDFFDSINISSGISNSDKSISFKNDKFSENQYAHISYSMENGTYREVQPHIRGCLCRERQCIRLCYENAIDNNFRGSVYDGFGIQSHNLSERYDFVHDRPCSNRFLSNESVLTLVIILNHFLL